MGSTSGLGRVNSQYTLAFRSGHVQVSIWVSSTYVCGPRGGGMGVSSGVISVSVPMDMTEGPLGIAGYPAEDDPLGQLSVVAGSKISSWSESVVGCKGPPTMGQILVAYCLDIPRSWKINPNLPSVSTKPVLCSPLVAPALDAAPPPPCIPGLHGTSYCGLTLGM